MPRRKCPNPNCQRTHPIIVSYHSRDSETLWPEKCPYCGHSYKEGDKEIAKKLGLPKEEDWIKEGLKYLRSSCSEANNEEIFGFLTELNRYSEVGDLEKLDVEKLYENAAKLCGKFKDLQKWLIQEAKVQV